MSRNKLNKKFNDKKKLEKDLPKKLSKLYDQGIFLSSCFKNDVKSKKYGIAKKRYMDIINKAEKDIQSIKNIINELEEECLKSQKRKKLGNINNEQ